MNRIQLNTIGDSPVVVKKGSQVQSQEKTVEITENGTTEVVPDAGFALSKVTVNTNVESGGSATKWTGHADAEGLRAIGWTDEDIAYYQANGVNWNEEDDEYHKVTDDNKALYGVLTANNISTYKDRIVYLPKIDTSGMTHMRSFFMSYLYLEAIPLLDTSNVVDMAYMFKYCNSLRCIPLLDTSKVTDMTEMFSNCAVLSSVPQFNTDSVIYINGVFSNCSCLQKIPVINSAKLWYTDKMFYECHAVTAIHEIDTSLVTNFSYMFYGCFGVRIIPQLDLSSATNVASIFANCRHLVYLRAKNLKISINISYSPFLSKDSLLYIINNEAATSAITITLAAYAYTRLAEDADVVAALANHPNVSLASA